MKIQIWDWRSSGQLLEGSRFKHGEIFDGSADDVFLIARDFYDRGLNVMIRHYPETNTGTRKKPNIVPESVLVAVDTHNFQQR